MILLPPGSATCQNNQEVIWPPPVPATICINYIPENNREVIWPPLAPIRKRKFEINMFEPPLVPTFVMQKKPILTPTISEGEHVGFVAHKKPEH